MCKCNTQTKIHIETELAPPIIIKSDAKTKPNTLALQNRFEAKNLDQDTMYKQKTMHKLSKNHIHKDIEHPVN